ncbi:UNVERIFIED_CONTAM: hypothetical protein FKN15_050462 [Acipenser sinensis]
MRVHLLPQGAYGGPRTAMQRIPCSPDHGQLSGNFQTAAEQQHLSPGVIKANLQTAWMGLNFSIHAKPVQNVTISRLID